MSTLLNKGYLVKVSTKGEGGVKNAPNSVYVVCTQPLSTNKFCKISVFVISHSMKTTVFKIYDILDFNNHIIYKLYNT